MKTGGTLRQRAERLFLTRDTPVDQIDRRHFAKGSAPAAVRTREENERIRAAAREAASLEAKVRRLSHAPCQWRCGKPPSFPRHCSSAALLQAC
jgi:splicing factor 3A subunit 3